MSRKKLSQKELNYFKDLIKKKRDSLLQKENEISESMLNMMSENNLNVSRGDVSGSDNMSTDRSLHFASREGKFLGLLEEALFRIKEGTFGQCHSCENLIPKVRLEAVPVAKMCIECKQKKEKETMQKYSRYA